MEVDEQGMACEARLVQSPNCDQRPPGEQISLLVIHCISLPPGSFGGQEVEQLFTNSLDCTAHPYFSDLAGLRVSAHFFIRRDASLIQFVPAGLRAWHAGQSNWRGRDRCNDFSVGIELEGTEDRPFEAGQYARLAELTDALKRRYPIQDVVGHSDIAPVRKTDPGPFFDWAHFLRLLSI